MNLTTTGAHVAVETPRTITVLFSVNTDQQTPTVDTAKTTVVAVVVHSGALTSANEMSDRKSVV